MRLADARGFILGLWPDRDPCQFAGARQPHDALGLETLHAPVGKFPVV
jgi:hypothetical protein